MFPFDDNNPTQRTSYMTYALVAVNVVVFLWGLSLQPAQLAAVQLHYGFIPARIGQLTQPKVLPIIRNFPVTDQFGRQRYSREGKPLVVPRKIAELPPDRGEIILSLFTCMFLHGGWMHLIFNMWYLWLFGKNVEDRLGKIPFLLFYLVGGLFGSAGHWLINPESTTAVIGASGAVAAVLGAYAVTWPWAQIRTLLFLGIFITIIEVPALIVLGVWFLIQVIEAHGHLGLNVTGGVAWWVHIAGFIAGMILMPLLCKLLRVGPLPEPPADDFDQRDQIIDARVIEESDKKNSERG